MLALKSFDALSCWLFRWRGCVLAIDELNCNAGKHWAIFTFSQFLFFCFSCSTLSIMLFFSLSQ